MTLQQIRHCAPALLIAIAFSGIVPGSAAVATATSRISDATHPTVMQQVASEVATAKMGALHPFTPLARLPAVGGSGGTLREVFGFALASSLNDPTFGYPTWNFSLLTTVAFFGLHIQGDGNIAADSGWNVWNSSQLSGLLGVAHASGTKVVVTIILQDFAPGTPNMCAALGHEATTIARTVAEVQAKGVDGVNVDFEGLNGSCGTADPSWARHSLTNLLTNLRLSLPGGSYLSVDTYGSSAADPIGFFDVPALAPSVDSFFVMAYDMEYANYLRAPLSCAGFCLGPTAPLTGYYYNDTSIAGQYAAAVPASKVILGVPYYGRKGCVTAATPNQIPTANSVVADSYLDASTESTAPMVQPGSFAMHRDANDPSGQERWDTWINTSLNCTRELYWDDTVALSQKYALVNQDNLRGVGIWNLNYGGGAPELWSTLNTYFGCAVALNLPAAQTTTEFNVGLTAGSCTAVSFELQQLDTTLNQGWFPLKSTPPTAVADGFPGDSYQLQARVRSASGVVGTWTVGSTTVPANAILSHGFRGLYTLDAYGGVGPDNSPPLTISASWPGWKIARAAKAVPAANPQSGIVLDGYGGLHPYGVPVPITITASWPGWDIARDVAFLSDGTGGYVLDGYGGLHPFSVNGHALPPAARTTAAWPGWDIARKVAIFTDGTGGYVMDGYGGLHPFGITGAPPAAATGAAYWPGWQIARDVVVIAGSHMGYVLDGFGGLHPFSGAGPLSSGVSWPGWDIARAIWLLPGATPAVPDGYLLDGYGGVHPFDGATALGSFPYWPGQDIARTLTGF